MAYTMKIYTDGGCRRNGRSNAIGAAAAVVVRRWGKSSSWTRSLPSYPRPTNQRAEISGIILALQLALKKLESLHSNPRLRVTIYTDSKYAIGCMTDWIYKWAGNGWINVAGNPVANRDLIEEASNLDDRVKEVGRVRYVWIPREENERADGLCNLDMDRQEEVNEQSSDDDLY